MKFTPEQLQEAFTQAVTSKELTGDAPALEQFAQAIENMLAKAADVAQGVGIA